MLEISTFLDYQVSNTLKTLTAVLEPLMLLFVGIGVGLMMVSIIAPIYGMIGKVGVR
jgi:type IV pilus assembly protein PilC